MKRVVLMLILVSLAGCAKDADDPVAIDEPPVSKPRDPNVAPPPTDTPFADFVHDLSVPIDGVTYVTEQYLTTVPGQVGEVPIELDTWIIRPVVEDPVPIVLEVTPYYTGGAPANRGAVGTMLLERGYAVGVSSVRGTGNSGGCFTQGGTSEAKDTAAVIQRMSELPWTNGNVGLIGVSYPGTTPQDVWVEAPPALKTIVPISGISDMYRYNFVHGVHVNPQGPAFNTYYWILEGPGTFNPSDTATVPGAVSGEVCPDQVFVQEGGVSSGVDGNKDAYWQERDFGAEYLADTRDVDRASVFFIHGLQDWNVKTHMMEGWLDLLWDSGVPMKVWLGQWGHAWPASSNVANLCESDDDERGPACRSDWWDTAVIAWFDQFLKETDTGVLDAPRVQVQDDNGRWRHEHIWPPRDTTNLTFYMDGASLSTAGPGTGMASYAILPSGATSPVPTGPDRITFVSEPLTEDITVSGLPHFIGDIIPSGNRANLIISLGQRAGGGESYVNYGVLSLNHANDLFNGVASVAGTRLSIDLPFFPQDDVFYAGNQIVLTFSGAIMGGPGPGLLPVNDPGTIEVDLSKAKLVLPVDNSLYYESRQPYVMPEG